MILLVCSVLETEPIRLKSTVSECTLQHEKSNLMSEQCFSKKNLTFLPSLPFILCNGILEVLQCSFDRERYERCERNIRCERKDITFYYERISQLGGLVNNIQSHISCWDYANRLDLDKCPQILTQIIAVILNYFDEDIVRRM